MQKESPNKRVELIGDPAGRLTERSRQRLSASVRRRNERKEIVCEAGDDMALNWVEELVGQLYQTKKGYLVVYDLDLPMPKTDSRSVRGHSDIDVLAISNGEVVNVECQSWWGPGR